MFPYVFNIIGCYFYIVNYSNNIHKSRILIVDIAIMTRKPVSGGVVGRYGLFLKKRYFDHFKKLITTHPHGISKNLISFSKNL